MAFRRQTRPCDGMMLYPYRRTQRKLAMHTNLSSILRSWPNKGPEPSRTGPESDGSAGPVDLVNPAHSPLLKRWVGSTAWGLGERE